LNQSRHEGVTPTGKIEECNYDMFGWNMDPKGNKIEIWEPVEEKLDPQKTE